MAIHVYTKERGVRKLKDGVTLKQYRDKFPGAVQVDVPDVETLQEWMSDGVCECIDGCMVEPDGTCEHGSPSWLVAMGVI